MNDLRKASWAGSGTVINEPGNACSQGLSLVLKDLPRTQRYTPLKVISDCQSLINS